MAFVVGQNDLCAAGMIANPGRMTAKQFRTGVPFHDLPPCRLVVECECLD